MYYNCFFYQLVKKGEFLLRFLVFMCVIGSLQASSVEEIFVGEDENQIIPIQNLSGKKVCVLPADKELHKFISMKNTVNSLGEPCILLSSSDIGDHTFTTRVINSAIKKLNIKSGKYMPFEATWRNFALSGEYDTCHILTSSTDLKEILVLNSSETPTCNLSINFPNSLLRLKFSPLYEGVPYWIQGRIVPKTIQIDTSEKKAQDHQQPAIMTDFSVLKFESDLQVINASVEVIFATSF